MTLRDRSYLVEGAPKRPTKAVVSRLKKSDRLLVYHGTYSKEFEVMAHGVDALRVRSRYYNQGSHAGLFVAPDVKTAASFGRLILELSLPVRGMHAPVAWSGNIEGRKEDDIWRDRYPHSFRPSLSASLLSTGEPQALYRGFVRPKDILGVYEMDQGGKLSPRMSLKDARKKYKVREFDVDLTSLRLSIADFVKMLGYPEDKVKDAILGFRPKSPGEIRDMLAGGGFGKFAYGEKALNNLAREMYRRWVRA